MPTDHILSLLIAERDKLNRAIEVLGGMVGKKRGRPRKDSMPDWVTGNGATAPAPVEAPAKKKRNFSPAFRKAAALRMKKMWRVKRAAAKKAAKKES
jgi:hypothetical protein